MSASPQPTTGSVTVRLPQNPTRYLNRMRPGKGMWGTGAAASSAGNSHGATGSPAPEPQPGLIVQRLVHREIAVHNVFLRHVAHQRGVSLAALG